MKTFRQFLEGILDADLPNEEDGEDCLMRALEIAVDKHRDDVMSFLMRLGKHNPDIQSELDNLNHKQNHHKTLRMGSPHGNNLEKDGNVVVPNSADSAHGEMPV